MNKPANGSAKSIKCRSCNAGGPLAASFDEAQIIAAWNARHQSGRTGAGGTIPADHPLAKGLRTSQKALDEIKRQEQANIAGYLAMRDMPIGSVAAVARHQSGRTGAGEALAYLVERLEGDGYGKARRVLDAAYHDPTSDDFWADAETKARHRVTPLYASTAGEDGDA